jgi:hypothetical protein
MLPTEQDAHPLSYQPQKKPGVESEWASFGQADVSHEQFLQSYPTPPRIFMSEPRSYTLLFGF